MKSSIFKIMAFGFAIVGAIATNATSKGIAANYFRAPQGQTVPCAITSCFPSGARACEASDGVGAYTIYQTKNAAGVCTNIVLNLRKP